MPAPTALRRLPEELEAAANIPLPIDSMFDRVCAQQILINLGQDEELLLDAPMELSEVQPATEEIDSEMHIDEEGKPRYTAERGISGPSRVETRVRLTDSLSYQNECLTGYRKFRFHLIEWLP